MGELIDFNRYKLDHGYNIEVDFSVLDDYEQVVRDTKYQIEENWNIISKLKS